MIVNAVYTRVQHWVVYIIIKNISFGETIECRAAVHVRAGTGETRNTLHGFEGHADLTASATFLKRQTNEEVRPMARPVRFEWDDHEWSEVSYSPVRESPKEQRTNQSTSDGKIASGETA